LLFYLQDIMRHDISRARLGVTNSITASVLFGVTYFYVTLLAPLSGEQIYGWRVLMTLPFVTLLLLVFGEGKLIAKIWERLVRNPAWLIALIASAALLSVQLWLFMWAPVNGHGLSVSLGYFLLPLTLVLTGRLVFGERLTKLQVVACGVAALGVLNELLFAPVLSWPTFVVAFGYPVYFAARKKMGTNHLGGMWFDMVLSLPVAIWFVCAPVMQGGAISPSTMHAVMIVGLGLLSATSLACMVTASHQLKLGLFGLLSYLEPALLVVVSLLLGERVDPAQWPTYICIWAAILILIAEGVRGLVRKPQSMAAPHPAAAHENSRPDVQAEPCC